MTTSPMHTGAGADAQSTDERARAAVKVFRSMQPGLTSFARVLTGRKEVRVELAAGGPRTDGTKIYYRPPIALGSGARHDRQRCDRRDADTQRQRCDACAVREEVMIQIYHEISHIAFGSFKSSTDEDKKDLLSRALKEYPGRFADQIKDRVQNAPEIYKNEYMGLAGLVSEFLPPLLNALEDVRIDNAMFKARKGTKAMFDAMVTGIFIDGIETDSPGVFVPWSGQPLNAQITVGVFCLGSEYDYKDWFSPSVEAALNDNQLRGLVANAVTSRTAGQVYRQCFPILARLRELGFLKTEFEEDDDNNSSSDDTSDDSSDDAGDSEDDMDNAQEGTDENNQADDDDDQETVDGSGSSDSDSSSGSGSEDSDESSSDDDSEDDEYDSSGSSDDGTDTSKSGVENSSDDSSEEDDSDSEDSDTEESDEEGTSDVGDGSDSSSSDGDSSESSDGSGVDGQEGQSSGEESESEADSSGSKSPGGSGSDRHDESGNLPDRQREVDEDRTSDGSDPEDGDHSHDDYQDSSLDSGRSDGKPESGGSDAASSQGASTDRGSIPEEVVDEPNEDSDTDGSSVGGRDSDSSEPQDDSLIDSGADEGKGGKELHQPEPPYGTPSDLNGKVEVFAHHGEIHIRENEGESEEKSRAQQAEESAIDIAIIQGLYFEQPSANVGDVKIWRFGDDPGDDPYFAWAYADHYEKEINERQRTNLRRLGQDSDMTVPESIMGPATLETRRTFNNNQRANREKNMKSGKVRANALGKRAWSGDERLFGKRTVPGKKSYSVIIGIDISGSTVGENLVLAKKAAFAQAELCQRVGIDFAVYAHTTGHSYAWGSSNPDYSYRMDMYEVKSFEDEWTPQVQHSLGQLSAAAGNLDGHSIEFYRKLVERRNTTDKIIMYYTDGKMPAANHAEELEIMQREIKMCKRLGIALMGVGIRTDSPIRHGLDTVQINGMEDLGGVVSHLGKKLNLAR